MKFRLHYLLAVIAGLALPCLVNAQSSGGIQKLHTVLENLYNEMIPLCAQLTDVARAIGAFGALWYIGYRVFKHIANAEAIDFFPLFKPFVLALLISFYPYVLTTINGLLKPMSIATGAMVKNSNEGVNKMLEARGKQITSGEEWKNLMGGLGYDDDKDWYRYQNPEQPAQQQEFGFGKALAFSFSLISNTIGFIIKGMISIILQILYYAAALCIDTLRTFHLLILGILGPFVLCLCMFDGFQHTLTVWLGRYINIYLWLPIANLFGALIGKIQEGMLKLDIDQSASGDLIGFGPTDMAYLIFLVIAIIGYCTVPSIANYVVHASGANALMQKTNSIITSAGSTILAGATGGTSSAVSAAASNAGSIAGDRPGADVNRYSMADSGNSEKYNYSQLSGNQKT